MGKKRHTTEEIVNKLRQADVELAKGQTIAGACKLIGVTDQTYFRWRKEYGGIKLDQAKRFKENSECCLLYLNLLGHKQGAGLVIMTDLMKFDFIGNRWRKPSAADDANFASNQSQFGNVHFEPNKIIDMRRPHSILHERWVNCPDVPNYFAFLPW